MNTYYEFYAPFAHIPGRYEWCRIHSATHGSFDCFIVIGDGTDKPVTVYLTAENGMRFMHDRFPESRTIAVEPTQLQLRSQGGPGRDWIVEGDLTASEGPIAAAHMRFRAAAGDRPGDALPQAVPYGGAEFPVWGSRWRCEGVDLELSAQVDGHVTRRDGAKREELAAAAGILTLGSYGALHAAGPE